MRRFAALHGLRVGCVQYLNARPLIAPYDGPVVYEHPGRLADLLAAGEIDLALIPVFEALRQPEFPIADGVAIASRGPVYSVFMAHLGPVEQTRAVTLDPASRTSNNLLRCLFAEFYHTQPEFQTAGEPPPDQHRGVLLIGDHAIRYRQQCGDAISYLDLGEEWLKRTGLPFVYAVWQMRPDCANLPAVADALRAVKAAGVSSVREIDRNQPDFDPAFAARYLTQHIRFNLGPDEKAGLTLFQNLLTKHRLLSPPVRELQFL